MNARTLTGTALANALRKAVDPTISEALQRNAERLRQVFADAWGDIGAGTPHPDPLPQGERETEPPLDAGRGSVRSDLSLDVTLSGENLFAREFGALDAIASPVMAPAIERMRRRSR